jgi:hypothetical protein
MNEGWLATCAVTLMSALQAIGFAQGRTPALKEAWSAWDSSAIRSSSATRGRSILTGTSTVSHRETDLNRSAC